MSVASVAGVVLVGGASSGALADPSPQVVVSAVTEDGQHLLRAVVSQDGKPRAGLAVSFGVRRTFGIMELGTDTTLDDGSAAVAFPEKLPGDADGSLGLVISFDPSSGYGPVEQRVGGGVARARSTSGGGALWASAPPRGLVIVFVSCVGVVLGVYGFVAAQLAAIKLRRKSDAKHVA